MRRLTRFSLHHRRAVGLAWLFLLLAAVGLMAAVPARDSTTLRLPGTGSQRAGDLLRERFPAAAGDRDQLVFHARSGTLRSASGRRAIDGLLGRVARLPHVVSV